MQGGRKGPPLIACFPRKPQTSSRRALGPGVLSPCQPSCLRNDCVLQGNKGFSQHRLSWCCGVSFSYNTWVLRDANLGLRPRLPPFFHPLPFHPA